MPHQLLGQLSRGVKGCVCVMAPHCIFKDGLGHDFAAVNRVSNDGSHVLCRARPFFHDARGKICGTQHFMMGTFEEAT